MHRRYDRNFPALTEAECVLLRSKTVAVIGCGGLGGHLIDQLARIGIGGLHVVDGDVFDTTNLNRQLLSSVQVLGRSKAQVAGEHIQSVNPEIRTQVHPCFLTEKNAESLIRGCDAVLDGLDNPESRRILSHACAENNIPYIYGAISGWIAQAGISLPGDRLVDTLYPEHVAIKDKSVLSFTPSLCASMQTALCVKLLTGRPVQTGTVYYFDLLNQEFETIPMV